MSYVIVHFQSLVGHDVDAVARRIVEAFEGAAITSKDWYSDRIHQTVSAVQALWPQSDAWADPVVQSAVRASERFGPTKGVQIPVSGGGNLSGQISRDALHLHCDTQIPRKVITQLMDVLSALHISSTCETSGVRDA
jgi:hypothetical protein